MPIENHRPNAAADPSRRIRLGGSGGDGGETRGGRRVGLAVLCVLMIDSLATGMFVPVSMLYLVARSDLPLTEIGALLSVAGLVSLPLPLWIGRLVDRVGARRIVLLAQTVQAAGFAVYLLPLNAPVVLVAATVVSVGQRMFWSSVFVLVSGLSDRDPDTRARERWLGTVGALRAAGYGLGALVSGIAVTIGSLTVYESIVVANAVLLAAATVLVATLPSDPVAPPAPGDSPAPGYRILLADRPYLRFIALNIVFALCNVMLGVALAPFVARAVPELMWLVGPVLLINTAVQAVAQRPVVRLLAPLPRTVWLILAGMFWAAWALLTGSALFLPPIPAAVCLVTGVLCYSAAQLSHAPSSNAIAADAAPPAVRGRYPAVFQY